MTKSQRIAATVQFLSRSGVTVSGIAGRLGISERRVYQLRSMAPSEQRTAPPRQRVRALPVGAGLEVRFG
ncbi:helix-turn-helix domain-containing protein [Acetobacter musti]|uniref:helix-turn-helix domain-containing protein n=1 Tax=Acetobacter musti TaxID=864732 RepID=UPI0038CFBC10